MSEATETVQMTADVICVRGGEVLLIERGWPPYAGHLALPGGYVDAGETSRTAAARELREETGVDVAEEDLVLIGVYDRPDRDPRGRFVSVAYMTTVQTDTIARPGDDAAAVQWTPLAAPRVGLALAFDHSQIVADALHRLARSDDSE
ncbi:DNA hydrolase [Streptomyces sp. WAC 04229]|uniref:NUDIX domain-containing protein n=1 Tax=Streptomyces sp. WAC 04229 TaxID=2203206 RepID=UPI000F743BE1|nr:NUDIX hydrolase [Streptomyces sp. WAC 04229]RSN59609.1 DNA hydrolase [Streptomyces sp. WAC 04229]